ncbi:MAG: MFS transporter [Bacteroidales bacterium]|nr:MFS transporter [Bacteroidales bacterium]
MTIYFIYYAMIIENVNRHQIKTRSGSALKSIFKNIREKANLSNRFFVSCVIVLICLLPFRIIGFVFAINMYDVSHSVTQYTLIPVIQFVPVLILSPFMGVFIDRFRKNSILIFAVTGMLFSVATIFLSYFFLHPNSWLLYFGFAVGSLFSSSFRPLLSTIALADNSKKSDLSKKGAWIQFVMTLSDYTGPLFAILLLAFLISIETIFVLIIILLAIAVALSFFLLAVYSNNDINHKKKHIQFFSDIIEGFKVFKVKGLRQLLIIFSISLLSVGYLETSAIPLFLGLFYKKQIGVLICMTVLGMASGNILMILLHRVRNKTSIILVLNILIGLLILLSLWNAALSTLGLICFLIFLCFGIIFSLNSSIWQVNISADVMGRAQSFINMISTVIVVVTYTSCGPIIDLLIPHLIKEVKIIDFLTVDSLTVIRVFWFLIALCIILTNMMAFRFMKLRIYPIQQQL